MANKTIKVKDVDIPFDLKILWTTAMEKELEGILDEVEKELNEIREENDKH